LLISRDGGASWDSAENALSEALGGWAPRLSFPAVAAAANKAGSIYVSFDGLTSGDAESTPRPGGPGGPWRNYAFGVLRSDDAGSSFRVVWKELVRGEKSPDVDD